MKIPKVKTKPKVAPTADHQGGKIRNFGPKEAAAVGIVSGVVANALNQKVNYTYGKHEYEKATMYKRKMKNGQTVKVKKSNVKPVPVPSSAGGVNY